MTAKILWIERNDASAQLLLGLRQRGYQVTTVPTGKEALERFPALRPDLLVVQAASLRSSGARLAKQLRETCTPVLLIGDQEHKPAPESADEVLLLPFTLRKLLNRVRKLAESGKQRLSRGPLVLDVEYRYVLCNGSRIELTPRTLRLLQLFMEHPGEVLEREALYRTVWETDYTGDTRSLDVHISWLRRALGGGNGHLLKTIRGVGYRLDV